MSESSLEPRPWWRLLNKYHWHVFTLAALGRLFDTMDGQIFVMPRANAMADLLPAGTSAERIRFTNPALRKNAFGGLALHCRTH